MAHNPHLAYRLKETRERLGLTQTALAARTRGRVTQPEISRYEAGQSEPRFEHLRALARALDVEIAELLL